MISWHGNVPYAPLFGDVYFSKENGLQESHYVFAEGNDLITRFKALAENSTFVLAELGFGTGLNCLRAWQLFLEHAPKSAKLVIFSAEKHPLSREDLARSLQFWPELVRETKQLITAYPALTPGVHTLQFADRITLHFMLGDALSSFQSLLVSGEAALETKLRPWQVDAWFLDGFAPKKNPELWSGALFQVMSLLSKPGTTCATFSAAGDVRRGLEAAGFTLTKRTGFGKKRHCLAGQLTKAPQSLKKRQTPWEVPEPALSKKAIVVGAGLAGCFMAHKLARRGVQVTLLDSAPKVGAGGSGNKQAVLFPLFSAYRAPLTEWMLTAFLFAARTYVPWLTAGLIPGELKGLLQFNVYQQALADWLSYYPELGVFVDAEEASRCAGVALSEEALFVPQGGWLDSEALCEYLMDTPGIDWQPDTTVDELHYQDGSWQAAGFHAPHVVLATGGGIQVYSETCQLPLELFRGQMTAIQASNGSSALKLPLCGLGHVLPAYQARHWFGASYHGKVAHNELSEQDNQANLEKLRAFPAEVAWADEVCDAWAGVRAKTPDYLPLVGPVPDVDLFKKRFGALQKDSRWFVPEAGAYYPGLFVCAGFGSRGLTSIPLASEYLAALMCGEPSGLPRHIVESISPARFIMKQIKQGEY